MSNAQQVKLQPPKLTETQLDALGRAVERAYNRGWDGVAKGNLVPTINGPNRRWGRHRGEVAQPTCDVLLRKALVKEVMGRVGYPLTRQGIEIGEAEATRRLGRSPADIAAERRAEEAEVERKAKAAATEVADLFKGVKIKPAGERRYDLRRKVAGMRPGGRGISFTLDELRQIAEQLGRGA